MKDDIMPRILIYGEDGLTLKYTKERLGEILHKLGDNSNPADCTGAWEGTDPTSQNSQVVQG